jgi:hypothetical protein
MSNDHDATSSRESPEEARRWKRVYITVIIYTTLLIIGLWGFSQLYK